VVIATPVVGDITIYGLRIPTIKWRQPAMDQPMGVDNTVAIDVDMYI
jgi:hypothetical protein